MTTTFADADFVASALPPVEVAAILAWLEKPPAPDASDELAALQNLLTDLRRSEGSRDERLRALDRLYARSVAVVVGLLDALSALTLPLHRRTRQLVRKLQLLLRTLAEDLQASLDDAREPAHAADRPPELVLWRILSVLSQHLLISAVTAAPPGVGIWKHLHQSAEAARALDALDYVAPEAAGHRLQDVYYVAVLLGCAHPACFTSREVHFIAAYLACFVAAVDPAVASATDVPFWLDPERDAPAVATSRRAIPPQTPVRGFSCERLGRLLQSQLDALDAGLAPKGLPEFAATPAGRGVLRRLTSLWDKPSKRRFPRRRQNYRATLCAGLANLWRLNQEGADATIETSSWMIVNEGPDGYAVMHVSGKASGLAIGDIAAIRSESGVSWQTCIVRRALSENREHLELGLQLLATRATPALLALPGAGATTEHLPVVVLPAAPPLRASEMLVVPSGALEHRPQCLVLLVETGNLKVREIRRHGVVEQNSRIEVFAIETDPLSLS